MHAEVETSARDWGLFFDTLLSAPTISYGYFNFSQNLYKATTLNEKRSQSMSSPSLRAAERGTGSYSEVLDEGVG